MASNFNPLSHILFTLTNLIFLINAIEVADHYVVHMDLTSMPAPFTDHHSWYISTLASISTTTSPPAKLIYSYTHAISGFSATLTASQLSALKSSPGFLHSTRDSPVTLHTTHTSKFMGLGPTSGLWPTSHYGNDVIIGVVDSGIWPESNSFSDDGTFPPIPSKWKGTCQVGKDFNSSMCNNKLVGAQYFNKGLITGDTTTASARDTEGHGTHTSSTVAGNAILDGAAASYFGYAKGKPVGIAPRARLAVYKAFWREGSSTADVIAAIDKAIFDRVDVLSISLASGNFGDGSALDDAISIATFTAVQKGIFVSLSAGNTGPKKGTLHNGTPWALTVAAGTTDRLLGGTITLGNGVSVNGLSLYPETVAIKNAPLAFMEDCSDWKAIKGLRNDTVVVCLDSNSNDWRTLVNQIINVQEANVAAVIFITSLADLEPYIRSRFRAIFLDPKAGKPVINYLNTNPIKPRATLSLGKTFLGSKTAPKVAPYSSRGPSNTFRVVLKPDLIAPGDQIMASWSPHVSVTDVFGYGDLFNSFNIISGTSMACSHAAGVAALLKGAHPEWSPAMIRSAMMTTADTFDNSGQPIKDIGRGNARASALAMGAGHINPNKAMEPGLVYEATYGDYVDLLCALNYTKTQIKAFTGSSTRYRCSRSTSADLNYPSFMVIAPETGSREFWRTVTNVGEAAMYVVKVDMDVGGVEVRVEPTKIVFRKKYEKARFKVIVKVDRKKIDGVDDVDGSISWVDVEGKYVVRSPILITADN